MKTIGLTGNMGTGKSTVSSILKEKGICIIDMDSLSKHILENDFNVQKEIINKFSGKIITKDKIDRVILGEIVFSNRQKLNDLNNIMKKYIISYTKMELKKLKEADIPLVILDGAILFEIGINEFCEKIICVSCNKEIQIKRIIKRNNLSYEDALKRVSSQISNEELIKKCDYIIDNNGTLEELREDVENTYKKIVS